MTNIDHQKSSVDSKYKIEQELMKISLVADELQQD